MLGSVSVCYQCHAQCDFFLKEDQEAHIQCQTRRQHIVATLIQQKMTVLCLLLLLEAGKTLSPDLVTQYMSPARITLEASKKLLIKVPCRSDTIS